MTRGVTQTTRAPQNQASAVSTPHIVLGRNASDDQLARARAEQVGTIIERAGLRFMVREVYRDDLRRLVGTCEVIGGSL